MSWPIIKLRCQGYTVHHPEGWRYQNIWDSNQNKIRRSCVIFWNSEYHISETKLRRAKRSSIWDHRPMVPDIDPNNGLRWPTGDMWRSPVAPGRQIGEKNFFIAFLDELGNFEHFETYFIFSPIWRSGDRQLRQFGDFWYGNRQSGDNYW